MWVCMGMDPVLLGLLSVKLVQQRSAMDGQVLRLSLASFCTPLFDLALASLVHY